MSECDFAAPPLHNWPSSLSLKAEIAHLRACILEEHDQAINMARSCVMKLAALGGAQDAESNFPSNLSLGSDAEEMMSSGDDEGNEVSLDQVVFLQSPSLAHIPDGSTHRPSLPLSISGDNMSMDSPNKAVRISLESLTQHMPFKTLQEAFTSSTEITTATKSTVFSPASTPWNQRKAMQDSYREVQSYIASILDGFASTYLKRVRPPSTVMHMRSRKVMHMVDTVAFRALFRALLFLDACFVGFRASQSLSASIDAFEKRVAGFQGVGQTNQALHIVEILLMVSFVMELGLTVSAHGVVHFTGPEWRWHVADATLLVVSTFDVLTSNVLSTGGLLRAIRTLIRPLRVFRVARCAMALRHLRMLTISMLHSLVPLFYAFAFLWFLIYLFAVVFVQGTANYIDDAAPGNRHVSQLVSHFGDLPTSGMTLFMCITNGVDWNEVSLSLKDLPSTYIAIFVFYILFMIFSVSNIITGIFVQEAIEMATHDMELVEQTERSRTKESVNSLKSLFHRLDPDGLGYLQKAELVCVLQHHDVQATLSSLGLQVHDVESLFALLDIDKDGIVEIDEFVMGCLRVRGSAREVDLEIFMQEHADKLAEIRNEILHLTRIVQSQQRKSGRNRRRSSSAGSTLSSRQRGSQQG